MEPTQPPPKDLPLRELLHRLRSQVNTAIMTEAMRTQPFNQPIVQDGMFQVGDFIVQLRKP